jgi:hypothetical protein
MGPSAPGEQKTERARLSCLLHWGPAPSVGEQYCRTAGCERGPMPMQAATRLRRARKRSAANTVKTDAKELASFSVRVQATRLRSGSRDCRAVKLLSTQIVRKQAKAIFISNNAAHCMQRRRQRFPTVRMVGEVGNGEVIAKTGDIKACTSTARWKRCEFIGDSRSRPVEIACITAGKSVRLQHELCDHRRTLLSRRYFR